MAVRSAAHRVAVMYPGEIVEIGPQHAALTIRAGCWRCNEPAGACRYLIRDAE